MPMKLVDMAHYGRFYSYEQHKYPVWWYDRKTEKAVCIDELLKEQSAAASEALDCEFLERDGVIPFFPFDMLSLEMKYVSEHSAPKERRAMQNLEGEEFDRTFMETIDLKQSQRHWYSYELDALKAAAIAWAKRNRIRYDNNESRDFEF